MNLVVCNRSSMEPQRFSASVAWVLGASAESVLHCTGGRTRGRTAQEGAELHNRGQNCTTGGRTRGRTAEHGAELHNRGQNFTAGSRTAEQGTELHSGGRTTE